MNLKVFVLLLRNHEERYSEKSSTKYTYELIAFASGNVGYGVSESQIFIFFFTFVALYAIKDELKRERFSGDIEAKFSFYGLT